MSDLELVKEDVERYYKEQDEKGYNMVKDLRNSNLFNFETVLKFAAMYHATKRMEEPTNEEPALNIDLVSKRELINDVKETLYKYKDYVLTDDKLNLEEKQLECYRVQPLIRNLNVC